MGGHTRTLRELAFMAIAGIGMGLLPGCGNNDCNKESGVDWAPAKRPQQQQIQNDRIPPDGARQDPNKQKVPPPKPLAPKQLFSSLDLNGDGVIDENEMRAAYHCQPGRFCACDKALVESLFENRAEVGHVLGQKTSKRPFNGRLSAGGTQVNFSTDATYTTPKYGVNEKEFIKFVKEQQQGQ